MTRSERLLALLQALRRHRAPVPGAALADELGISLRTLYRDVAALQAQGATVEGSPGLGYVLRPGFTLPPLMFTTAELEALVLGMRWVSRRSGDRALGAAARDALAKITSVLPAELRREVDSATLMVGPAAGIVDGADTARVREAIRSERKLRIDYRDAQGQVTARTIWPFALGFFERVRVVVAWCELRQGLRHFRMDRVTGLHPTAERYPRSRGALLAEWKAAQGIPSADTI